MRSFLAIAFVIASCGGDTAVSVSPSPAPPAAPPPAPSERRSLPPTALPPAAALAVRVFDAMLEQSSGKVRETASETTRLWRIQRPDAVALDVTAARAERWIVVDGEAWQSVGSGPWTKVAAPRWRPSLLGYEAQSDSVTLALRSGRATLQKDPVPCMAGRCPVLVDPLLQTTLVIDPRTSLVVEARLVGVRREYFDYGVLNDIRPPR